MSKVTTKKYKLACGTLVEKGTYVYHPKTSWALEVVGDISEHDDGYTLRRAYTKDCYSTVSKASRALRKLR